MYDYEIGLLVISTLNLNFLFHSTFPLPAMFSYVKASYRQTLGRSTGIIYWQIIKNKEVWFKNLNYSIIRLNCFYAKLFTFPRHAFTLSLNYSSFCNLPLNESICDLPSFSMSFIHVNRVKLLPIVHSRSNFSSKFNPNSITSLYIIFILILSYLILALPFKRLCTQMYWFSLFVLFSSCFLNC